MVKFEKEKIEGREGSGENQISDFGGEGVIRNSSLSIKARRVERAGKLETLEQSNLRGGEAKILEHCSFLCLRSEQDGGRGLTVWGAPALHGSLWRYPGSLRDRDCLQYSFTALIFC